jgi:signal recognition particle GTPase
MFSRLRDSLSKSRRALTEQIAAAAFDPGDDLAWERLEEALIQADVGVPATAELVRRPEARGARRSRRHAAEEYAAARRSGNPERDREPTVIRRQGQRHRQRHDDRQVAAKLTEHSHSVIVAAADTFAPRRRATRDLGKAGRRRLRGQ